MGMWIASHTELLNWMQHDFWHKAQSLEADVPDPLLDYPERTTGEGCSVVCCTHPMRSLTQCFLHHASLGFLHLQL